MAKKSTGKQSAPTHRKALPKVQPVSASKQLPAAATAASGGSSEGGGRLLFSFCEIDEGGQWSPCNLANGHAKRLFKKLAQLGALTPAEARASGHLATLDMGKSGNKTATSRLANQYDGLDVLHEIRIERSQAGRLHGRLVGHVFNVIWWDPRHEIWPEGKQVR